MSGTAAEQRFDVIVIGCGPAGQRAAIHAARAGRSVAVVERAHAVGGARVNWGTIPPKTLRESAIFVDSLMQHTLHGISCEISQKITVADFMFREQLVVQPELELINRALDTFAIKVFAGHGRFADALYNYPTPADLFRHTALEALHELRRAQG
jgi:NAD(P) transhydrogenase